MSVATETHAITPSAHKVLTTNGSEAPLYQIERGTPHPLGATPDDQGVNFSIFSQNANAVQLLLFDAHNSPEPVQVINLTPQLNKTFHFWHVYVRGLKPGTHYAYRVDGPTELWPGHRFNRNKVLVDPYAKGNTTTLWNRGSACGPDDNIATSMRSVVIDTRGYDWEGDRPINRRMAETIIYEVHVGGFTRSQTAGVQNPGTFRGLIQKIPYLKELGVTAVELLPIFEYDDQETGGLGLDGKPLPNFWGYSTVGFFAPESSYCVTPQEGGHLNEFRDMVKALHKEGIEVILDVVFNHTSEGNHNGPTFSFRGFDNSLYYHLVVGDRQYYMDYSGCGNTMNCNHPIVEKFIVECLEFWVREMHVDGFRFDEGSIMSRGEDGAPMAHPPVVWNIELSEELADTKIIAEAWDAAGLYQIGYFPGYRWAEWNGKYRDDIRRFVKGDPGMLGAVAARISGSADIYETSGHEPINSINFITCHDGFTLNDVVSYDYKHNDANGEGNRDGINDNQSWNCGVEGDTDDPDIQTLRARQVKNFAAILLLSQGVPMILGGDEIRRTQQGNNNAYCQNNELSWYDWTLAERHRDIYEFFKKMIGLRKRYPTIHRGRFFCGETCASGLPDVSWHSCQLNRPEWYDGMSRVLAFTLGGLEGDPDFHVVLNMHWDGLDFALPPVAGKTWARLIDTSLPSPEDIVELDQAPVVPGEKYHVGGRSVAVLASVPLARLG